LEFQLENAKNQFQLQCYRSDKYLRLVEELREEFAAMRENRDNLATKVRDMEAELKSFQAAARQQLNRDVNACLQELYKWRRFARRKVELDAAQAEAICVGNVDAPTVLDDEDEDDELPSSPQSKKLEAETNPNVESEKILLRWANSVVRSSVVSTVKRVSNFTTDYQSGEVVLLLLHAVHPTHVPLSPLQEMSVVKRVDQIVEIARNVGVGTLPRASDILEAAGDMMVIVTAELYNRFVMQHRVRQESLSSEVAAAMLTYDADMMTTVLADSEAELSKLAETEKAAAGKDVMVWKAQESLQQYAGFILRERLDGRSVMMLDTKDVQRFCKFSKLRYGDIAFKYQKAPVDFPGSWQPFDLQLDELSQTLQKHYQDLRKAFTHYCNGKSMISDGDFWRFCADIRVLDAKLLTRQHVDKIFQIANNDEPPLPPGKKAQAAAQAAAEAAASKNSTTKSLVMAMKTTKRRTPQRSSFLLNS